MKIKSILFIASMGLLLWLLVDNISQLDIAATKNDGLLNSSKSKVDGIQNIDTLKAYAKSNLDLTRNNFKKDSKSATKRIIIIVTIIILQLTYWAIEGNKKID